jgi:ribosomal protein S12 methylthiotransferase accessory factor YcaO
MGITLETGLSALTAQEEVLKHGGTEVTENTAESHIAYLNISLESQD